MAKVETPMDFETIEGERLPHYTGITQLQEDLILTFRNCCVYNGETHEFSLHAM